MPDGKRKRRHNGCAAKTVVRFTPVATIQPAVRIEPVIQGVTIMTRKHFEALATALWQARDLADGADERAGVDIAIRAVADACEGFNDRFDRDRFEQAYGLDG